MDDDIKTAWLIGIAVVSLLAHIVFSLAGKDLNPAVSAIGGVALGALISSLGRH